MAHHKPSNIDFLTSGPLSKPQDPCQSTNTNDYIIPMLNTLKRRLCFLSSPKYGLIIHSHFIGINPKSVHQMSQPHKFQMLKCRRMFKGSGLPGGP